MEKGKHGFVLALIIIILLLILAGGIGVFYFMKKSSGTGVKSRPCAQPEMIQELLKQCGAKPGDPVFFRMIKEPKLLELWMQPGGKTQYDLVATFPFIASGEIGPKTREGDLQAPEGYYRTFSHMLNPNSQYHLSFNVGYPNPYDLAHSRTGSSIMVHGKDKSRGCFAMGDPCIEVLYDLVESYLKTPRGSKEGVPIQIYPFIPTQERMLYEKDNPNYEFWQFLQRGWDFTEKNYAPAPVLFESGTGRMILDQPSGEIPPSK